MTKQTVTPCIGICSYNDKGSCVGCYRTSVEIVGWFDMSDDERDLVMKDLDRRAAASFD